MRIRHKKSCTRGKRRRKSPPLQVSLPGGCPDNHPPSILGSTKPTAQVGRCPVHTTPLHHNRPAFFIPKSQPQPQLKPVPEKSLTVFHLQIDQRYFRKKAPRFFYKNWIAIETAAHHRTAHPAPGRNSLFVARDKSDLQCLIWRNIFCNHLYLYGDSPRIIR